MSNHYQGSAEEILALDTFVKFTRSMDSVRARIGERTPATQMQGSQFGTLEMLYHLGPLNQKDIGAKLLISKSNVVGVIDKLEQQGFVKRQRSIEDRRVIFVHLTDAGETKIEELLPGHVAAIQSAFTPLNAEEQKELGRLCRKLGLG